MARYIRIAKEDDADQIQQIYAPYVRETSISFETTEPSREIMRSRIRHIGQFFPWLVSEEDGKVTGYAYANKHGERTAYQWSVDVSIYIRSDRQHHGAGTALYSSLLNILISQGFYNAYAVITLPNQASVGLHEKMGFKSVGVFKEVGFKDGAWRDVGYWHLALQPTRPNPPDPIGIHDLLASMSATDMKRYGLHDLESQ